MFGNIDLPSIVQFLEKHWHRKTGLAVALVFLALCVGFILATADSRWFITVGVLAACGIGVSAVWHFSNRVPKTKMNHVGFIVGIRCEDDEESKRIREDFVFPLRQLIGSGPRGKKFHFIELPQHLSNQINDSDDAQKLRVQSRAHFMLYGRVRERILDAKLHHVIELHGVVTHKPVQRAVQQEFSREFSELLPRNVHIDKDNDLLSFQFTSEWAGIVAQYIIGVAAYFSGDLDYAEELYLNALQQLQGKNQHFPIYARLVERLPIRLSELNEIRTMIATQEWRRGRTKKEIEQLGNHLEKVADRRRRKPDMLLASALHAFVTDRDTNKALKYLKQVKGAAAGSASPNVAGAWNYSMAFLKAYDGNLKAATQHYRKAARIVVEPDIITQIEDFLCWILKEEPDKYQFHYCLGFFNWKTKGDVVQAENDFNKFLAARREGEFEKEKDLVAKWLVEMHLENDERS